MSHSADSRKTQILTSLFNGYEGPAFAIRLWDGWSWSSSANLKPVFTVVLENPKALAMLIGEPNEITLGEAFIHGDLDVEGDIFSVFSIAEHLLSRTRSLRQRVLEKSAAKLFALGQQFRHGSLHSLRRDRDSISYHYDQPVAFFEPWLGKTFAYSCAYFRSPQDPLDLAQEQKLELICQKLRLQPQERFLDIGCGWGSLILHAADRHGAQCAWDHAQPEPGRNGKAAALFRPAWSGLAPSICGIIASSKPASSRSTKSPVSACSNTWASKTFREYFGIAHRLLRPGGVFLNHGIARSALSAVRENSFIEEYVFPGGTLVTLPQALSAAESQGLEVRDVENLRDHYASHLAALG